MGKKVKSAMTHIQVFMCGVIALFTIFLTPYHTHAENIDPVEKILSFVSHIDVKTDGSFTVTEHITYNFPEQRHGMYRCIPTIHQDKASSIFKERYIDIAFTSVEMDGHEVPYTTDTASGKTCLKIGDPTQTISGKHIYDITYTVGGAITYEKYGGADLYWNVTGNEWEVPIVSVSAEVLVPETLLMRERSCYKGAEGEQGTCQGVSESGGVIYFKDQYLKPGEGMTIAQALNRTKISHDVRERFKTGIFIALLSTLGLIGLIYGLYRYKTQFKTNRSIIPQYEPYAGMKPMYTGVLFDGRLDPSDIVAAIIYLAQQGFIQIRKTEKKVLFFFEADDYEFTLRKQFENGTQFEKSILELIFVDLKAVGDTMSLSDLKSDNTKQKNNVTILNELKISIEKDLILNGFFQKNSKKIIMLSVLVITMVFFGITQGIHIQMNIGALFEFLLMIIIVFFAVFTPRRTRKGYEALDHLKGFEQFLSVTERDRYMFHNAPEKSPEQFMEYLPYAIAFGVEKQWAKTFEGITIPNPSWYDGGAASTFNTVSLTQSLGAFSTAFVSASGTSPSSGGGSAGGGSGGGGGGSW